MTIMACTISFLIGVGTGLALVAVIAAIRYFRKPVTREYWVGPDILNERYIIYGACTGPECFRVREVIE